MSDAVPSIFPWSTENSETEMETMEATEEVANDKNNASPKGKDPEIESVAAIQKFIEDQEKEIQELKATVDTPTGAYNKINDDNMDNKVCQSETISVASSMIDMIISESELELARKRDIKNKIMSPADKGNGSMALSVGSKVEAKDFGEEWYSAEIIEVDYEEMEVLVHYETDKKKHDEWISVSSPRLRPIGSSSAKPRPISAESWSCDNAMASATVKEESIDQKVEEKVHPTFEVGERCLARWRDNRRFVATIRSVLPNGSYEIVFDDGCHWTCKVSRLYKLRPGKGSATIDVPNTPATPYPQYGAGPSNIASQTTYPAFHTHLFDPTRDYLGSKSERREMKRKLNIKEIFNIGQKRPKTQKIPKENAQKAPVERKPRIIRRKDLKLKRGIKAKTEMKTDIPAVDAVASIIGTHQEIPPPVAKKEEPITCEVDIKEKPLEMEVDSQDKPVPEFDEDTQSTDVASTTEAIDDNDKVELEDLKPYLDPEVLEEEVKLEQFEKPDEGTHEEVIDRIKEAINKLEDGLNQAEHTSSPKADIKLEIPKLEEPKPEDLTPALEPTVSEVTHKKGKTKLSKVKKGKKLRLQRAKNVKKQVEKVKCELAQMRKQMSEIRKQMVAKKEEMHDSLLLPGEWCCKWVNGQPVGTVSEIECEVKLDASGKAPLPRRSVQVVDKRLPDGWTKHMVRRSLGHSAGKWDVVLVSPDNRRFHTKNEMRAYLENNKDKNLDSYALALMDFGVHLKLARRMGWIAHTPDGIVDRPDKQLPAGTLSSTSPLIKRKKLGLKKKTKTKVKIPKLTIKIKPPPDAVVSEEDPMLSACVPSVEDSVSPAETEFEQLNTPLCDDGYVFVGSLKVQVIDNLLRCPADDCFKNFRNNTLLQMHIKHYHRELRKMMGATPKVLDLAYARTMPLEAETPRAKDDHKIIKVKIPRLPKPKVEKELQKIEIVVEKMEDLAPIPLTPIKEEEGVIRRSQDSPKLRQALINKPVKRPRVLLPVRRVEPEPVLSDPINEDLDFETKELIEPSLDIPPMDTLDFETAISSHTVTKPMSEKKRKWEKKKKSFVLPPRAVMSEEEDWLTTTSDVDTRSSYPRSGTPDSKFDSKAALVSSESNEDNKDINQTYTYNENGERIKIVHMKREEIINCHCGFREEDGLMVQCELCLCWQHALCHNIQREADVPEKYTCSICLQPRRGRRSARFLHAQERLYEGALPGGAVRPCDALRRSHELSGNLLRITDTLHALRVKYYVATKKDHPKLYLWANDWEHAEIQYTQEKLNSDYSDLNIMINSMGKENVKDMDDIRTSLPCEDTDQERFSQRDVPGCQSLLSGLLSSPGAASLDIPISTLELERLAQSVQEQESQRPPVPVPVPEAPIENGACRARLLKHLQRCQALVDARLDSIEAQVAELESQDPSFEDDETADYFPRTKQTIQMLMRDLDTMEDLGVIT